jgi:hypothetical protein
LLGNSFIFFVDHSTLLYLVNKLTVTGWIAKWLLLLQKIDLKLSTNQVESIFHQIACLESIMGNQ